MTAGALLLTPGAGATRDNRILVGLDQAVSPLPCVRLDFPYRAAGRRMPDPAPIAVAHLRAAAEQLVASAGVPAERLVLGGRSYGGRMCSMAVAEGLPAAGLILLSYPLHPPGRPEKLRVDHFPQIGVPVLFIGGEKDPFGTPEEFARWVPEIRGPVTQVWLSGGHDPRPGTDATVVEAVRSWLDSI
jgi:predicted alpha/beta-hydrolase family hydrolase